MWLVSSSIFGNFFRELCVLMNAPPKQEVFLSDAKENVGIAALCRGFLTMYDKKRAVLV